MRMVGLIHYITIVTKLNGLNTLKFARYWALIEQNL